MDLHEIRVANVAEVRAHWQAFVNTFLKPLVFVRGQGFFDERRKMEFLRRIQDRIICDTKRDTCFCKQLNS